MEASRAPSFVRYLIYTLRASASLLSAFYISAHVLASPPLVAAFGESIASPERRIGRKLECLSTSGKGKNGRPLKRTCL